MAFSHKNKNLPGRVFAASFVNMQYILLIEDDPFLIDIYSTKLKKSGFRVGIAKDGEEALAKLKKKKPDLVVLDIVLPHLDGWEILANIKTSSRWKDLRVIILSNLGQKEEVEKGMSLGASKYLIKAHHTPTEIVEQIKKCLKD